MTVKCLTVPRRIEIESLVLKGSVSGYMTKDGITDKRLTSLRRGLAYRYMTKKRMAVNKGQMFDCPKRV
jgi:hypothetical protein